ncbi:uncharacterized protein [Macrobrachium rosenbergii]|uniref:uncharacterized protein n=1 Tax=Macrobrachium rosenbergii TaxID=79674 RepID=UPI0034D4D2FC
MVFYKLMLLAVLVGTVMSAAYPNIPPPVGLCDNWCGVPPNLKCCDRKCPIDDRPLFDCNRPNSPAIGGAISGPRPCHSDSDCSGNALCCWDSCLAYKKCTNV